MSAASVKDPKNDEKGGIGLVRLGVRLTLTEEALRFTATA